MDEEEFDLHDAIKEAISRDIQGVGTEFVLIFRGIDNTGDLVEAVVVSEDQTLVTTAGMLTYASIQTDMLFREGIQKRRDEGGW